MSRVKGGLFTSTLDVSKHQPLDSRELVTKYENLINPTIWKVNTLNTDGLYNGLRVSVVDPNDGTYNGVYFLLDRKKITTENYLNYLTARNNNEDISVFFEMWTRILTKEDKQILIVKSDKTTSWEESSYVLGKGELGIGYYENGKVIVKCGSENGNKTWEECNQIEGVLEEDLILTYNFGKYQVKNGSVNAGGAGMTVREWLQDALSEVKEPQITKPSASISATFSPSSGEVGTQVSKINWNGSFSDGVYQYGSVENKNSTLAGASAEWEIKLDDSIIGNTEDGSYSQNFLMTDDTISVGLKAKISLNTENIRTPINNMGNATSGKITTFEDGTIQLTKNPTASIRGYRKMFVGTTTEELTSEIIRKLNLKSVQATTSSFEVEAPIGANNLIIACPTNSQGKNYILQKAEMFTMSYEDYTSKFIKKDNVQVADCRGGANGLQDYNIYIYSFEALKTPTKFKLTLKSI